MQHILDNPQTANELLLVQYINKLKAEMYKARYYDTKGLTSPFDNDQVIDLAEKTKLIEICSISTCDDQGRLAVVARSRAPYNKRDGFGLSYFVEDERLLNVWEVSRVMSELHKKFLHEMANLFREDFENSGRF